MVEVAVVSLEGPDQYSQAGGLGVRSRELCRALAARGFETHLFFVGDPGRPAREDDGGVHLVRWIQDISLRFPLGVYDGEPEKVAALTETLPGHLIENVITPAVRRGRIVVVLCEEWQTVQLCIRLARMLDEAGLRERVIMLWNANNRFGFDDIDWQTLTHAAGITTVSRYMKQLMRGHGARPVVVPNGIPEDAFRSVDPAAVRAVKQAARTKCLTFKMGRFSADKGWHQAVSAISQLRRDGLPARMLMRGGIEGFGGEVLEHARAEDLDICQWQEPIDSIDDVCRALIESDDVPIVNLTRFLPTEIIPEIEVAATAVLANSNHEPFGLVGLEAMAAGAVAIVGATGEEYARSYANAIVIETDDPREVASALRGLVERPDLAHRLRMAARHDAAEFTWPKVIDGWLERLRFMSMQQRVHIAEAVS
jgi:glycosyltransferase involved in cell wall biosynthesis